MGCQPQTADLLLSALMLMTSGCTTTGGVSDPEIRRLRIDNSVDIALENLYLQVDGARDLVNQCAGALVFLDVLRAGIGFAAVRGHGALRVSGSTRSCYTTTSGSFGLQAGIQSTAVFLIFMTGEALAQFQNSSGRQVGADASVTIIASGVSTAVASVTTQQPVIGFVLSNRGLMAGISLDGSRIARLDL